MITSKPGYSYNRHVTCVDCSTAFKWCGKCQMNGYSNLLVVVLVNFFTFGKYRLQLVKDIDNTERLKRFEPEKYAALIK